MDKIFKVFNSEIKGIDEKEQTITAYISTDAVDRQKEVLDPEGVDLKHYNKNPIVLWAHDYSQPPIAKALWVKKDAQGILSKMKFASTDFAQEIFQLYKEGFLKAFSVGFIPKETEWAKDEDRGNPKKPNLTYKKWEMLEYSAVPVPANPEALTLAMQKGMLKSDSLKALIKTEEEPLQEFNHEVTTLKTTTNATAIKINVVQPLDDLTAENKILSEEKNALQKENAELKYKLFVSLKQNEKDLLEITADNVVKKIEDVARRVIRQAQGKID